MHCAYFAGIIAIVSEQQGSGMPAGGLQVRAAGQTPFLRPVLC